MVTTGGKYEVSGNDLLMWWQHDDATTAPRRRTETAYEKAGGSRGESADQNTQCY